MYKLHPMKSVRSLIDAVVALKNFCENPKDININQMKLKGLKHYAKLLQRFDKALAAVKTLRRIYQKG